LGLCVRIWDNIFAHGTVYIFKVAIAILKLIEPEIIKLDLSKINDVFKSFKDDEGNLMVNDDGSP